MSDLQALTYEPGERVARITLNRPERGNGITRRLVTELEQCVERADLDPEVRVILLQSNGKGFCGGYDLVESAQGQGLMGEETVAPPPGSPLDPSVMKANHDPRETWDPMVDYAMMSRNVRAFMSTSCR
jgi:enoyl-CoA hydratase